MVRADVYQGTGTYQIVDHRVAGGVDGFISVLGAKYTTARKLAELATSVILRKLRSADVPCRTRTTPLVGGDIADLAALDHRTLEAYSKRFDTGVLRELVANYGTEFEEVLKMAEATRGGCDRLAADRLSIEAEVRFAVEREMALRLDDVVFRRTGLGTLGHPGGPCLARCAEIMAESLGWSNARAEEEIRRVEEQFVVRADS
jgi:glycerol-3-phosphate dehydrogenase